MKKDPASLPQGYVPLALNTVWKLFDGQNVAREAAKNAAYSDSLTMPDGSRTEAIDLTLDENGKNDLNTFLGRRVPVGTPSILVNEIEAESPCLTQIGIGVDWWFVCYLNGAELYSTLECGGNRNAVPEKGDHVIELPLKSGKNTLSILFLAGSSSRKIAIGSVPYRDLSPKKAELRAEPWLLNPAEGEITIRFTTSGNMAAALDLREKGAKEFRRSWHTKTGIMLRDTDLHTFHLTGLTPGAKYEYKIALQYPDTNAVRELEKLYTFTAPGGKAGDFNIFLTGDSQLMPEHRKKQISALFAHPEAASADFIAHIGDAGSTFNSFEPDYFDGLMDVIAERTQCRAVYLPMRGNHEFFGEECARYADFFGTPEGLTYQAFAHGGAFFVILDTGCGGYPDAFLPTSYMFLQPRRYEEEQKAWLKKVVASSAYRDAEFRVVFSHAAPALLSRHDDFGCGALLDECFSGFPLPDLWIGGHVHAYRRSLPGSDRMLSNVPPPEGAKLNSGKELPFPVITIDGPRETGVEQSGTLLRFRKGAVTVTTFDTALAPIDGFTLFAGGGVEELFSPSELPLKVYDL